MVNAHNFARLCNSPAKVLFLGDPAQLPPVGEGKVSPTFDLTMKFQMTSIVRQQAGNPIIGLSLMVRQRMAAPGFVLLDDMRGMLTNDPRFSFCTQGDLHPWAMDAYARGWNAPILAFRNATVIRHNLAMHEALYPGTPLFGTGERVLSSDTLADDEGPILYNGEVATCEVCKALGVNPELGAMVYEVTLTRDTGETVTLLVSDEDKVKTAKKVSKARIRQSAPYRHSSLAMGIAYHHELEYLEYLNRFAKLRHSYACTVHKSQGSTFDVVFMDWRDISSARDARMHYVAATRAATSLVVAA